MCLTQVNSIPLYIDHLSGESVLRTSNDPLKCIFTQWRGRMTRESVIQRINGVLCCSLTVKPSHNALKQPYDHTDTHIKMEYSSKKHDTVQNF